MQVQKDCCKNIIEQLGKQNNTNTTHMHMNAMNTFATLQMIFNKTYFQLYIVKTLLSVDGIDKWENVTYTNILLGNLNLARVLLTHSSFKF